MSNRLDKERESRMQPKIVNSRLKSLQEIGVKILAVTDTRIDFELNGNKIQFFPYSGWHTGKGIKDGRGWKNLLKQLK